MRKQLLQTLPLLRTDGDFGGVLVTTPHRISWRAVSGFKPMTHFKLQTNKRSQCAVLNVSHHPLSEKNRQPNQQYKNLNTYSIFECTIAN